MLHAVPALYMVLKVAGGLYLAWLAWQIWQSAPRSLDVSSLASSNAIHVKPQYMASFRLGLITQVSNPKAAVIYGSVFAALVPAQFPLIGAMLVAAGVFLMEFVWYAIVVLVLSSPAPRAAYMRGKTAIDRIAAGVMGLLAARLISTAHQVH